MVMVRVVACTPKTGGPPLYKLCSWCKYARLSRSLVAVPGAGAGNAVSTTEVLRVE